MATLTVGTGGAFATILDAMSAAQDGDSIALLSGYRDEAAEVTRRNITFTGDASNTGILLTLSVGITHLTIDGTAPIDIVGNAEDNVVILTATGGASGAVDIGELTVTLGSGNDTLVIDNPDGGLLLGAITYHGGGNPADALEIRGGAATGIHYTPSSPHDGTLTYIGAQGTQTIHFTGLAPVFDSSAAATLLINGTTGADTITVSEGGAGQTTVGAPTFESVTFANKTTVTVDGLGGSNSFNFADASPATGLTRFVVLNASTITQSNTLGYDNVRLEAADSIVLTNGMNDVDSFAAHVSSQNALVRFRDVDGFSVAGISANEGSVELRNDTGTMTIGTGLIGSDISVGSVNGHVRLQSGSDVTQTARGTIVSDTLGVLGGTNVALTAAPNDNDFLAIKTVGLIEYRDIGDVVITTLAGSGTVISATMVGVTSGGSNINLQIGGNLTLDDGFGVFPSIDAGAGTARLNVTGAVSQIAASDNVVAGSLGIRAGGAVTLGVGSNDVDMLAVSAAGAVSFNDIDGLSIRTVAASGTAGFTSTSGVITSGSNGHINLTASGSIILDGGIDDSIRATSGNVTITATGAASNVEVRNDSTNAIDADAGNVTISAGQDIYLGSVATNKYGDIEANGNITLSAGRDIFVAHNTFVDAYGTGALDISGRFISITDANGVTGARLTTEGGAIRLTTAANALLTVSSGSVNAINSTLTNKADGDITLNTDRPDFVSGTITAGTATVNIRGVSAGRLINLGSATNAAANTLELSDAELDRITAAMVRIGTSGSGNLAITSPITPGGTTILGLQSGGAISDGTGAEQTDITESSLSLVATGGIGSADDLDIDVDNLTFFNTTSGNVNISNAGALTIASVDHAVQSANFSPGSSTTITAGSPLTIAMNIVSAGGLALTAGEVSDAPAGADDLTIVSGVTVSSQSSSVFLRAGDDIVLAGSVTAVADEIALQAGFADLDTGGSIARTGGSLAAPIISLSALTGIGASGNPVVIDATFLEAQSATGGIFISDSDEVSIGFANVGINGIAATISGDIGLTAGGSIILGGDGATEGIHATSGAVTVNATGASSNVEVFNNSTSAIDSDAGNVTITAGQDILLGSAAVDKFGDVEANGNLTLSAGRDVVIDENTFVDAFGAGTLSVSAGRHISILSSDGTTGARMKTQGGSITLVAGDSFMLGAGTTIDAGGGNVLIHLDVGNADPGVGATANLSQGTIINAAAIMITGGEDNDAITGGAGSDFIAGAGGNDTMDGGSDADNLRGGGGYDTAVYGVSAPSVVVTPGAAGHNVITGTGTDNVQGVERLLFSSGYMLLQSVEVGDFNNDGRSDVVLRNGITGDTGVLLMNGTQFLDYRSYSFGREWRVVGAQGDFNGDGKSDLAMRNDFTGQIGFGLMDGKNLTTFQSYDFGAGWQVVDAEGDFNADGQSDVVLRNDGSGAVCVLTMNGVGWTSFRTYAFGTDWHFVDGESDFNNDGKSDLVIRNEFSGNLGLLLMDGVNFTSYQSQVWGTDWQVAGARGDFNADGKSDIVMHNEAAGSTEVLLMSDLLVADQRRYEFGAEWQVDEASGDYNNDGKSDLILRSDVTGRIYVLLMDGKDLSGSQAYDFGTQWRVADADGDFNADGMSDLVLRNHADGKVDIVQMNGMSITTFSENLLGTEWNVTG